MLPPPQPYRPPPSNQDLADLARNARSRSQTDAAPLHLALGAPLLLFCWWTFHIGFAPAAEGVDADGSGAIAWFGMAAGCVGLMLVVPASLRMLGLWNPAWDRFLPTAKAAAATGMGERLSGLQRMR